MLTILYNPINQFLVLWDFSSFTYDFKFRVVELIVWITIALGLIILIWKLLPTPHDFTFLVIISNVMWSFLSIFFYCVYNETFLKYSYDSNLWYVWYDIKNYTPSGTDVYSFDSIIFYLKCFTVITLPILIFIILIIIGYNILSCENFLSNKHTVWYLISIGFFTIYTFLWLRQGHWLVVFEFAKWLNDNPINFAYLFYTRLQRQIHCVLFLLPALMTCQYFNIHVKIGLLLKLNPYTSKFITNWLSISYWQRLGTLILSTIFYILCLSFYKEQSVVLDLIGCLSFLPVIWFLRYTWNILIANTPILAMVRAVQTGLDESATKLVRSSKTQCEPLKKLSKPIGAPRVGVTFPPSPPIFKPTVGSVITTKLGISGPVTPSTLNLSELSKSSLPKGIVDPTKLPLTALTKFEDQLTINKQAYLLAINSDNPNLKEFREYLDRTHGKTYSNSRRDAIFFAVSVALSFGLFGINEYATREERLAFYESISAKFANSKKIESIAARIEKGEFL